MVLELVEARKREEGRLYYGELPWSSRRVTRKGVVNVGEV